jgi:mRNA interferase MazF
MTASAYLPDTGDLIWTDFEPTKGREQAGRRPALVVSPAARSRRTPTWRSSVRPPRACGCSLPASFCLRACRIAGEILTSHIRSIDTRARPIRYAGVAVSD